ncbi:hypothetical protein D1872_302120 [compost metagenome]
MVIVFFDPVQILLNQLFGGDFPLRHGSLKLSNRGFFQDKRFDVVINAVFQDGNVIFR